MRTIVSEIWDYIEKIRQEHIIEQYVRFMYPILSNIYTIFDKIKIIHNQKMFL